MKKLNFYPYYDPYLKSGAKTTTFRLGSSSSFLPGEEVMLSLGWNEQDATPLHRVRITAVYEKPVRSLSGKDFEGESPDCQTSETSRLVLGAIYKRVVNEDDTVRVIKFEHVGLKA